MITVDEAFDLFLEDIKGKRVSYFGIDESLGPDISPLYLNIHFDSEKEYNKALENFKIIKDSQGYNNPGIFSHKWKKDVGECYVDFCYFNKNEEKINKALLSEEFNHKVISYLIENYNFEFISKDNDKESIYTEEELCNGGGYLSLDFAESEKYLNKFDTIEEVQNMIEKYYVKDQSTNLDFYFDSKNFMNTDIELYDKRKKFFFDHTNGIFSKLKKLKFDEKDSMHSNITYKDLAIEEDLGEVKYFKDNDMTIYLEGNIDDKSHLIEINIDKESSSVDIIPHMEGIEYNDFDEYYKHIKKSYKDYKKAYKDLKLIKSELFKSKLLSCIDNVLKIKNNI